MKNLILKDLKLSVHPTTAIYAAVAGRFDVCSRLSAQHGFSVLYNRGLYDISVRSAKSRSNVLLPASGNQKANS